MYDRDETRLLMQDDGTGKPKNGFVWTFVAPDDRGEHDVAYVFAGDRSGETPSLIRTLTSEHHDDRLERRRGGPVGRRSMNLRVHRLAVEEIDHEVDHYESIQAGLGLLVTTTSMLARSSRHCDAISPAVPGTGTHLECTRCGYVYVHGSRNVAMARGLIGRRVLNPAGGHLMRFIIFMIISSVGCGSSSSTGTCEYKYAEGSRDGSLPAGLEVCASGWVADKCTEQGVDLAGLGLKMTGFKFTKGAECPVLGYKDCSGGRGVTFYKDCPK